MSHPLLAKMHDVLLKIKNAFKETPYKEKTNGIIRTIEMAYVKTANGTFESVESEESNGERLSAKQKRALETATIAEQSTNNATVVSSADGAKVQNNLEILADNYEKRPNKTRGFITDLSKSLGLVQHEASQYGTFETRNGKLVTIRVSNHNARVSFFDENGEENGISIVISSHKNKGMLNDGKAHLMEYFYPKQSIERSESKPLADIVKCVSNALDSGKFDDTTGIAQRQEVNMPNSDENVLYSLRQKPEPEKKGTGYKVFVLGKDGKLYPPMVANPNGAATPVGVWLDADAAPVAGESKTGRPQVKQGGKGTQGGSGKLAYRPGWHLGVIPYAIQFNRKDAEGNKTLFPKNFVFAEVEYAADKDYQDEAHAEGINSNGKYQHSLAGLKHLPTDGYYMYRINPNPETDPWVITGAMKVNRLLTRAEQADIVRKAGREPQKIQEGDIVTDDVVNSINQEIAAAPKFSVKSNVDNQGNPLNQDGTLKLDKIKSVDDLTDEDFTNATRNVQLPTVPQNVDAAIGANGKPVIIKKNIFEKNWNAHKFTPAESRKVLSEALYNTDLVGRSQPTKKPNHWVAIKLDEKSPITVLEVNDNKDNVEVVGWYTLDERNLGRIKRQAERNGGELIMLSPNDKVESLSTPSLNSAANVDNSSETSKQNGEKFSLRLQNAISETDTEPTEAQKKSGNYKKGHVKFGGYDYTIENPKGSYRSGVDENGKEWKQKMNDTYGYIRGKFGKDGDHLDMFINDKADLDSWNGDVFVVDQVNPDGKFDEHKVMYGYDSLEEAKKAYLSNYEKGWTGLGNITPVSKADFDKWLDKSNRKLKPFADYADITSKTDMDTAPSSFEEFLDAVRYSIRNEKERAAAEDAYNFAQENRPDRYSRYAIVNMEKPGAVPQYLEKKTAADNWRRYYNKLKWGNYKLFDLDKPFEDNVKNLVGKFPETFRKDNNERSSLKSEINGGEPKFSLKDEKTLAGVHNITEEKLRKVLKLGGFANPSLAVIDTNKTGHDNFGEISFIAPSALLDKRTGKTAGTWITDAYTQRYPSVEREMSEKGYRKFEDWVDSLDYTSGAKAEIERQAKDALSDNNAPAWELMYLKEKGIDIKEYDSRIDYHWREIISDHPTAEDILNSMKTDPELKEKVTSLAKYAIIHPTWEKVSLEVRRKMYKETGVKASPINPQVRKQTKEIFERDYAPSLLNKNGTPKKSDVKKVVEQMVKEHNDTKKYDFYLSKVKASNYVNKNGLYDDYIRWQENKLDEFGTKNRIFRGYTRDGSRKYVPETLENVSKVMREEADGQTNGSEYTSFGSFIAKLASRVDSTDEMRANKDKLSSNKDKEEFYEKWNEVYYDLAKFLYNDVFYGEQRLHDIVLQSDPKKYAKKEYGITLTPTFMKKLDALKNAVRTELKSAYFETKYNRPLRLNEFAAAVVPDNLGEDVRKGIENAGLPIYDYDPTKEGDRSRAFNEAINSSDNIRFSLKEEKEKIVSDAKANGTYMTAPNGEKTKLNAEQWVTVRTTNFKNWFGDWEKDPENASKVVDENGEPLVVYHGRSTDFNIFEKKQGVRFIMGLEDKVKSEGFFFTPDIALAEEFAGNSSRHRGGKANVISCFLNIRRPMDLTQEDYDKVYTDVTGWEYIVGMDTQDNLWGLMDVEGMSDKIKAKGYDGAVFVEEVNDNYEPTRISYCALDANQIKSADNNNGDFSTENDDIRYSLKDKDRKQAQMDIILKTNPMLDDYHTGIRKVEDIKTLEESVEEARSEAEKYGDEEWSAYPDITNDMLQNALETGEITIYSSKPIKNGVFVTPSYMQASDYAGGGNVYEKTVPLTDVAWINTDEGQYAKVDGERYSLKEVNDKFNDRLAQLIENPNQKDRILHLGRSSQFLIDGGIADAEIELDFDKFVRKSSEKYKNNHPFSAGDIKDLPKAIAYPVAVFNSTTKKDHVVMTELNHDGKNFIVAIRATEQNRKNKVVLEVNQITSLYPKGERGIIYWINNNKLSNVDKEKALHFIEALQPHAGTLTSEELSSAANIVRNFVNPKQNDGNLQKTERYSLRVDRYRENQWKKDNNLPKDAERPQLPVREPNDRLGFT